MKTIKPVHNGYLARVVAQRATRILVALPSAFPHRPIFVHLAGAFALQGP